MIEAGKDEDTIDHDLISLPDLDSEEQDSNRLNRTTNSIGLTVLKQIAHSVPIIDDIDNQSSEIEIDPTKTAGRWTKAEHELFLQGIKLHNKQWKMVAKVVKTRTVVQVRTHAQKYFQKLEKIQNRKAGKVTSKASSGKLGESDSVSSSKSSGTDEADFSDAEKSGNGKTTPKAPSSSVKRQPLGAKLTSATASTKDNNVTQLIMRTQSMSAIDQNSKLPSNNIGMQNSKATPHLLQFGPQKRAREEGFQIENNVAYNSMMFYQPQYSSYTSPMKNNFYASPTKTNVHAMNRCYTFDNWDASSRMHNMYDTTLAGSDEVNDQALISMLNTIDWTSHSRSPDNNTNSAPAIVPEGRCSPLNPISVSDINEDEVQLRKPIPSHINSASSTLTLGQLRSDEVSTERNSSISGSSDDTNALLAATTDEDISTSTSYDSKFTMSLNSSPSEKKNDPSFNPLTTQADRQEVPTQSFLKFSLFRGFGGQSESNCSSQSRYQSIPGQGYLATPKGNEHLLLPYAFDPRFRNAAQIPSSEDASINGNLRSISRSSSDSFDTHPDGCTRAGDASMSNSPMKNTYYSTLDYDQKFCQNEIEILRSVSSTDELNQRMPSLSIMSGQNHIETTSKSPAKRRGRPRKVPITPARSTSTFTSYNGNSKPGLNGVVSGKSGFNTSKDGPSIQSSKFQSLAYASSANRISPIPELSPTTSDQNDSTSDKCNDSSPSFNELLVGIDSGGGGLVGGGGSSSSGDGDLRNTMPSSPFSAAAATLDIRAPRSDCTTESRSATQMIREEDFGYFSHCDSLPIIHDMNIANHDLESNAYVKMEEDMFIGSDAFDVFDAPLSLNYKF